MKQKKRQKGGKIGNEKGEKDLSENVNKGKGMERKWKKAIQKEKEKQKSIRRKRRKWEKGKEIKKCKKQS